MVPSTALHLDICLLVPTVTNGEFMLYSSSINSMRIPLTTAIMVIAILLIPLAIWIEHYHPNVWNQRLATPVFEEEPNRHTPIHTEGTYLPPTISQDSTLTSDNNPYLLTGTTTVPENVTLTIEPGTHIYAHEFAGITIQGALAAKGTDQNPITFTTNELHPLNKVWSGITVAPNASATADNVVIEHASPGISCLPQATAAITNSVIQLASTAFYSESASCTINSSIIRRARIGITTIGYEPRTNTNQISSTNQDIKSVQR